MNPTKVHDGQKMQKEQVKENQQNVQNVTIPSVEYQDIKNDENYVVDPFAYKLEPRKFKVMSDEKRFSRKGFKRRDKGKIPDYLYEDHINRTMYENEILYDPENSDVVDSKANNKRFTYYFDNDLKTFLPDNRTMYENELLHDPDNPDAVDSKANYKLFTYHFDPDLNTLLPDIPFQNLKDNCIANPSETAEQITDSPPLKLTTTGIAGIKNNPLPSVNQTIKNRRETLQKLTSNEEGELNNRYTERKDDFDPFTYKMEPKKFKTMSDEKRFSFEGFERKPRGDYKPANQL